MRDLRVAFAVFYPWCSPSEFRKLKLKDMLELADQMRRTLNQK